MPCHDQAAGRAGPLGPKFVAWFSSVAGLVMVNTGCSPHVTALPLSASETTGSSDTATAKDASFGPIVDASPAMGTDGGLDARRVEVSDASDHDQRIFFGPGPFGQRPPPQSQPPSQPQCPTKVYPRPLKVSYVMLVVGRNASMGTSFGTGTTRIQAVEGRIATAIAGYPNAVQFGYLSYPATDPSCTAMPSAPVIRPQANDSTVTAALKLCDTGTVAPGCLLGDNRPMEVALRAAQNAFPTPAFGDYRPKNNVILLADGPPSCSGSDGVQICSGATGAVYDGTHNQNPTNTYVIALADSKAVDPGCLRGLAVSAMGSSASVPLFTTATDATELEAALKSVLANLARTNYCVIDLDDPRGAPHSARNLVLKISGVVIPPDQNGTLADGWSASKDPVQQITVHGTWCDQLQSVTTDMVEILDSQYTMPCP